MNIRRQRPTPPPSSSRFFWAVLFSVLVHVGVVVVFSQMRGGTEKRDLFAPIQMVELSAPAPGPAAKPPAPAPAPPPAPTPPAPPTAKPKPTQPKPPTPPPPPPPPKEKVIARDPTREAPPKETPKEPERTEEDLQKRLEQMRRKYEESQPAEQTETAGSEADVRSAIDRLKQRHNQASPTTGAPTGGAGEAGPRTSGRKSALQQLQYTSYYNKVWAHVKRNWTLPPSLNTRGLSVTIGVVIDRDGNIRHHELEESSGNRMYDESALKALLRAAPLPPIPSDMEEDVMELGFVFSE